MVASSREQVPVPTYSYGGIHLSRDGGGYKVLGWIGMGFEAVYSDRP